MSEKVNKPDALDELSLLLDEMNAGRKPECQNDELAELLAVAELIKTTSGPICPPQHILDQTVDRALAGIEAGKSKPSRAWWWFSGALGTAAAVVLVFGLNMLPSWQERVPIVPPPTVASQQKDAPQMKADAEKQPTATQAAPADTTPAAKQQAPAAEQKTNLAVAQVTPAESPKPPATAREKSIMAEEAPRTSQSKSAYIPEAAKSPAPAMVPLKIPGKIPDLVVTDRENNTLRQVFYKGTPQEITITQRLQSVGAGDTQAKFQYPSVSKAANNNPDTVTTVQITIGDQEVTIEGRQSRQELLNLAESLIP